MVILLLPVLAVLLGRVAAYNFSGIGVSSYSGGPGTSNSTFGTPRLCEANAGLPNITGQQTIAPNILQGGKGNNLSFTPVTWRTTVYQLQPKSGDASRTELQLWFDTNGANYTDNFALGWDACFFWMLPFSLNTFLRGQKDPGDCSATLDQACLNDLRATVNAAARQLVTSPTPGPNSNLTTNSLPGVCSQIASLVNQQFPSTCAQFFDDSSFPPSLSRGPPSIGGALTGPKSLVTASQCKTQYGSLIWSQFGGADNQSYQLASWWVTGILSVYLPIADYARPVTLPAPTTIVTCLRATDARADSLAPLDAPAPTPLSDSSSSSGSNSTTNGANAANTNRSLTGGAIAGIVVGAIIGILIGVAVAFLLFRRRQRKDQPRRASVAGTVRTASSEMEGRATLLRPAPSEAPNVNTFYEMSSPQYTAELHNKSFQAPVELPVHPYSHYDPPVDVKAPPEQSYSDARR